MIDPERSNSCPSSCHCLYTAGTFFTTFLQIHSPKTGLITAVKRVNNWREQEENLVVDILFTAVTKCSCTLRLSPWRHIVWAEKDSRQSFFIKDRKHDDLNSLTEWSREWMNLLYVWNCSDALDQNLSQFTLNTDSMWDHLDQNLWCGF